MKILIIDDDADIRRLVRAFLGRKTGVVAIEAESGEAGVATAEREQPDGILLDSRMPGMDGPTTFAALRTRPETSSIPVIFLTGELEPNERAKLEALGARGLLSKPFNPATLAARVLELLENGAKGE